MSLKYWNWLVTSFTQKFIKWNSFGYNYNDATIGYSHKTSISNARKTCQTSYIQTTTKLTSQNTRILLPIGVDIFDTDIDLSPTFPELLCTDIKLDAVSLKPSPAPASLEVWYFDCIWVVIIFSGSFGFIF